MKAWVTATNGGDVDGALALFNDELSFMLFDTTASNKDELRSIFDWSAGKETEFQIKDCQPRPEIIICTMSALDACMTASGLTNGLPLDMVFTIGGDGKIQRVTGALSGMAWPDYSSAFLFPQDQWLRANFADEAKKIGTLQDRREAGALQARMCRAYAESLKVTPTAAPAADEGEKLQQAPRPVLLVAHESSEDMKLMLTEEVGVMRDLLEKAGYKVVVASEHGTPIAGDASTVLKSDLKLADVTVDDYARSSSRVWPVTWIECRRLARSRLRRRLSRRGFRLRLRSGASSCSGMPACSRGKHFAMFGEMKRVVSDGIWDGEGVVQDGKIITSGICPYVKRETGRPDGTAELMQKLIAELTGSK